MHFCLIPQFQVSLELFREVDSLRGWGFAKFVWVEFIPIAFREVTLDDPYSLFFLSSLILSKVSFDVIRLDEVL